MLYNMLFSPFSRLFPDLRLPRPTAPLALPGGKHRKDVPLAKRGRICRRQARLPRWPCGNTAGRMPRLASCTPFRPADTAFRVFSTGCRISYTSVFLRLIRRFNPQKAVHL